ncbi:MAG: sec-independent protein translocase protein TatA [Thermoleophilaceae bacterium]|jgi:sec-independent protein translocase protein TatA|nr:sec-independent protein translocase protein TatA [Thermoleophilaceae bacterium]
MPNIGLPEIAIVLVIVLVIFGPRRLPELGKSLGSGMRNFKDSVTGKDSDPEPEPAKIEAAKVDVAADAPAERQSTPAGDASP